MGMTYVKPIYKMNEEGRNVFEGVLALDYKFLDIAEFLSTSYQESDIVIVAVVEEASPNYVIATSRGGIGSKKVLVSDETQSCPNASADCKTVRVQVSELNDVVSEAFATQLEAGFPDTELLPVTFEGSVYASQTLRFNLPGQDSISWRILILSPIEAEEEDSIVANSSIVAAIIVPSLVGGIICSIFLALFLKYRRKREIVYR
jgi:hypothetical protein